MTKRYVSNGSDNDGSITLIFNEDSTQTRTIYNPFAEERTPKEFSVNFWARGVDKEFTEYFDTKEEAKKFIHLVDNNPDLEVLEYNFINEV